jgi:hypothetical protein
MTKPKNREIKFPEPHFISRNDRPVGRWTVEECAPKRGVAHSNNVERRIVAPTGNSKLERLIRAHELMHTKISPADDYEKWIKRGIASHQSMVAVEELRVNYGLKLQGFDVAELLDGNEDADGEYVAIHNQWDSAVIFAVATAGTGGAKRFLVGVRRHNKLWADSLATIQKRFLKEIKKDTSRASNGVYSTRVENESGLAPRGFQWTERMAEYLDRLCKNEPKPIEAKTAKKDTEGEADEEGDVVSSVGPQSESSTPEEEVEDITRLSPLSSKGDNEDWGKLIWGKVPLTKTVQGNLGRKRISSNLGRNPRRIHRLYTDPQRRIFDRVKRAQGGIVLVDGSGSMQLTHANIIQILESAPGALVAIYSDMDRGRGKLPNIHIVAKDGKTVANEKGLPEVGAGNGVDYPALKWAVGQRKNHRTPLIWVTDGGVCTPTGGLNDRLTMSCIKESIDSKVLVVEDVEEAVNALKKLHMRQEVTRNWPVYFSQLIRKVGGVQKIQKIQTARSESN